MKATKLELWWWLIFNHKKFDQWISVNESIVRENTTQKLERQFEEKLQFLAMKDERELMLASGLEYPVLQIPIRDTKYQAYNSSFTPEVGFRTDTYNKKELMLPVSFCNERNNIDDFKRRASSQLAKDLIDKGLLKSRFWKNGPETVVEFYVNIYQK